MGMSGAGASVASNMTPDLVRQGGQPAVMTEIEARQMPAADAARLEELAAAFLASFHSVDDLISAEVSQQMIAEAQAQANEMAAAVLSAHPGERGTYLADTLRVLNWAAGFSFGGSPPPPHPEAVAKIAVALVRGVAGMRERDDVEAKTLAFLRELDTRGERTALSGMRLDAPALVYLVAHTGFGAVKVGVSEPAGSRIAHHRRQGWQLVAAFLVTARAAVSIETDILNGWRRAGLRSVVGAAQMPQGGWSETVAADGIDLAATVARACELALDPGARPHPVSPWGQPPRPASAVSPPH